MYHINPTTGVVGSCTASIKACPHGGFSGEENHFSTLPEALAEAERRLKGEYGQGTLSKKPKMIDSFEVWKAKKDGNHTEAHSEPAIALSYYQAILPVNHGELAVYCQEKGLSLEETSMVAEIIKRYRDPLRGGPSVLVTKALQLRIAEAQKNCEKLETQLKQSDFFKELRVRGTSSGVRLSAVATFHEEDYITHMSDRGDVRFEIYEHENAESSSAAQPSSFIDDGSGTLQAWVTNYNAYREHLWSRTLWEKELRARQERAGSLNL